MTGQAPKTAHHRRIRGVHLVVAIFAVMLAVIAAGVISSIDHGRSGSTNALSNTVWEPDPDFNCLEGLESGTCSPTVANPVDAWKGLQQIIQALKSIDPGATCAMAPKDGPRSLARCNVNGQTVTVPVPSGRPSPSVESRWSLAASVNSVVAMSGSPAKATSLGTILNTGNEILDVTAEAMVTSGNCDNPYGASPAAGFDVTPESTGPFPLPAGAVTTIPLTISVDETVPTGQYSICLRAESGEADNTGQNTVTVMNPPVTIDQSGMPGSVAPNSFQKGTIQITNPSTARLVGVEVYVALNPVSSVEIKSVSMENAECSLDVAADRATCTVPTMDSEDQLDLDVGFCVTQEGMFNPTSSVTVVSSDPGGISFKSMQWNPSSTGASGGSAQDAAQECGT